MGCNCILRNSQNYKYHRKIENNFNNPLHVVENYTLNFRSSQSKMKHFSHLRKYLFQQQWSSWMDQRPELSNTIFKVTDYPRSISVESGLIWFSGNVSCSKIFNFFIYFFIKISLSHICFNIFLFGPTWSQCYDSWIYNYLCNQCL